MSGSRPIGTQSNGPARSSGQGASQDTRAQQLVSRALVVPAESADDEDAAALLGEPVLGGIGDAPFDFISEVGERREHHREIAAALTSRRLDEAVDILEEQMPDGSTGCELQAKQSVNLPPEDALFAHEAVRLTKCAGDRVVLARKAAHEQVDIWDDGMTATAGLRLVPIEDDCDVLVGCDVLDQPKVGALSGLGLEVASVALEVAVADMPFVRIECMLGLGCRLPLVAPDHVETCAVECQMEASDAREQLRGGGSATGLTLGRGVVFGHGNPSRQCGGGDSSIIPALARAINLDPRRVRLCGAN